MHPSQQALVYFSLAQLVVFFFFPSIQLQHEQLAETWVRIGSGARVTFISPESHHELLLEDDELVRGERRVSAGRVFGGLMLFLPVTSTG